jgi:hypothetical protein
VDATEIHNGDISEVPHHFVIERVELFKDLPDSEKAKDYFLCIMPIICRIKKRSRNI